MFIRKKTLIKKLSEKLVIEDTRAQKNVDDMVALAYCQGRFDATADIIFEYDTWGS